MSDSERRPETSVVIRAFNEERWLPEVFAALRMQRYRDFEVLLVDSGSVDRTRDIAAENGARIIRLRTEDFTFGHSLNVGLSESRGRLAAIVSAHAIPATEDWLEKLIAPLRKPEVAMVYGGQRGHSISKFSELRDFERIFPDHALPVDATNPFANNANSAIRKDLWERHAFDEGLPGLEDIEWAIHWSHRDQQVVYVPDATVIHVHAETWPQVRRRYYREAIAARWVGIRLLRHIPGEIWRELKWFGKDLFSAAAQGRLLRLVPEILRFRYEKTVGTIRGIIESKQLTNPARKAEVFLRQGFQALVVHGPNRVRLEDRALPSLKPGEVLVRVSHVGICGTDIEIVEGRLGYFKTGQARYPIVPGHESSGVVVALGPRVTELSEGDRVVVECIQGCGECDACRQDDAIQCRGRREVGVIGQDGACATYLVTRARYVHRVPDNVTLAQAALTEPLAVVHKGLRRLGSISSSDVPRQCLVVGAGTIGHLAARVLSTRGHSVIVVDRSADRLRALNGSIVTQERIQDLAPFDWIVEATGQQSALGEILNQSRPGATLLLLGLPYAEQSFSFESIVAYDRIVVGSVGSSGSDFKEALATLPMIDATPFLQHTFPLAEFDRALSAARSQAVLKVMLTPEAGV